MYRELRVKGCQLWESHTGQRGPDSLSKHWQGTYWGEHGLSIKAVWWYQSAGGTAAGGCQFLTLLTIGFLKAELKNVPPELPLLKIKSIKFGISRCLQSLMSVEQRNMINTSGASSQHADLSVIMCKNISLGTSLVVQWLRISLAVKGTQVQSLARELRSHVQQDN